MAELNYPVYDYENFPLDVPTYEFCPNWLCYDCAAYHFAQGFPMDACKEIKGYTTCKIIMIYAHHYGLLERSEKWQK